MKLQKKLFVCAINLVGPLALVTLLTASQVVAQQRPPSLGHGTRSIVACDPTTRECGIAVAAFPTGVSAAVPVGEPGVMVANQFFPSLPAARAIIERIKMGDDAPTALATALANDPDPQSRQFGVAALKHDAPSGVTVATFTGSIDFPEKCAVASPTYSVQAGLQTSSAVCGAMADAFASTTGSLSRRLFAALKAGTPVGTDRRGEFSASIRVFSEFLAQLGITNVSAEASVERSARWERDLEFGLNAHLAFWAPADPRDRIELQPRLVERVLKVLHGLGYYNGPVNGRWTDEAEAALLNFELFNIAAFPKPTAVVDGRRYIDGPLAEYIIKGAVRNVLVRPFQLSER